MKGHETGTFQLMREVARRFLLGCPGACGMSRKLDSSFAPVTGF